MKLPLAMACILSVGSALPGVAQTGVLDQTNSAGGQGAIFEASWIGSRWQQQVRAGINGKLEGFNVHISGLQGSHISWRIRLGDGWNTSAAVFQAVTLKATTAPFEVVFVDASAANIYLFAGSTFVLEWEGHDEGGNLFGHFVQPPAAPTYPETLFRPLGVNDCCYRLRFDTFMIPGPIAPVEYCTSGTTTNGCTATIHASAGPDVSHVTPCTITVDGVEGQKTGIVFYGLTQTALPWCSGSTSFLCVKPPTMRTAPQNSGGNANACDGAFVLDWSAFQLATPGALGQPFVAGSKVFVQSWFRDPPSCKTTGLSNAVELTYHP
jgi:hypothetical protein